VALRIDVARGQRVGFVAPRWWLRRVCVRTMAVAGDRLYICEWFDGFKTKGTDVVMLEWVTVCIQYLRTVHTAHVPGVPSRFLNGGVWTLVCCRSAFRCQPLSPRLPRRHTPHALVDNHPDCSRGLQVLAKRARHIAASTAHTQMHLVGCETAPPGQLGRGASVQSSGHLASRRIAAHLHATKKRERAAPLCNKHSVACPYLCAEGLS